MNPVLSVVVPARAAVREIAHQTLLSLAKQDMGLHEMEIIVVDNGSTDEVAGWAIEETLRGGPIRLVRIPDEVPWMAAVNRGFEEVRGDYWSYVYDDVVLAPNAYKRLIAGCWGSGASVAYGPFLCSPPTRHVCSEMGVAFVVSTAFQKKMGPFGEERDADRRMWEKMAAVEPLHALPLPLTALCYGRRPRCHLCRPMRRRTDVQVAP